MPRISLKQFFLGILTVSALFAVFSNAAKLPPVQFWSEIALSDDGKWMFAVAGEQSWLVDLDTNTIVKDFNVCGDRPWSSQIAAFVDNDTIIAIDSQHRRQPRVVWISISKKEIVRELPIIPFTQAAVSGKQFVIANGRTFDILDSVDGEKIGEWDVEKDSSFYFSRNGKLISRTRPVWYTPPGNASTLKETKIYDIDQQAVVATHPHALNCVVTDDPNRPVLVGPNSATYFGREIPAFYGDAKTSIDGTLFNSGAAIFDSKTGRLLVDYETIREPLESLYSREIGCSELSADNKRIYMTNFDVDSGISVYDSSTLERLSHIRIVQSRRQKIIIGFASIIGVCLLWVFAIRYERRENQSGSITNSPSPQVRRLRIVWALMAIGGLIHICLNLIAMNHIPFSTVWKVESRFHPYAMLSASLMVGWILTALLIGIYVFIKGASGSTTRLKTAAALQMFIDPINTVLGLVSLLLQFRKPKSRSELESD